MTKLSFHKDFRLPTLAERKAALGKFPGAPHASKSRSQMILGDSCNRPEHQGRPSLSKSNVAAEAALGDLDNPKLYCPSARSETIRAIPKPRDDLDWLVNVPEEGQTFEQYVQFLTSRSGRIRPIANAKGETIVLLPIVDENGVWPSHGPPLEKLSNYTRAFFDRQVKVLPPAKVSRSESDSNPKKRKRTGAGGKTSFKLSIPQHEDMAKKTTEVKGRATEKHTQLQVTSLLDALSAYRDERNSAQEFCVMGITMEDLYDGPRDLFCAGMAFGGSKVAVFSFFRYHPHLKMHPGTWHNFGFSRKSDSYSYFEDNNQNPKGLLCYPPINADNSEFLRRSGKLLTHELGHLYGLDHCIFNKCLMMGTGHLVEDFLAPTNLCSVCLRKLQWRLGFDVKGRYTMLAEALTEMELKKESIWAQKQSIAK